MPGLYGISSNANVAVSSTPGLYIGSGAANILNNAEQLLSLLSNNGTVFFQLDPVTGYTQVEGFSTAGAGGNTFVNLTGSVIGSGLNTNVFTTLANSGVVSATYGNSRVIPIITVNSSGIVTSVTTANIDLSQYTGNVAAGNVIVSSGIFYANGQPFVSSSYGNSNVAAYMPGYLSSYTGNIQAQNINVLGNLVVTGNTSYLGNTFFTNVNTIVTTSITANSGTPSTSTTTGAIITTGDGGLGIGGNIWAGGSINSPTITTINANISGANAAIIAANTIQSSQINVITANIGAQQAQINSLVTNANANVQTYLSSLSNIKIGLGANAAGTNSIAIGNNAGKTSQGAQSVSLGDGAGNISQALQSVAIGTSAGAYNQGQRAIAIGALAGNASQGANSIAIGYLAGQTSQAAGGIVLNASGTVINGAGPGFYVNPVRQDNSQFVALPFYNLTTSEFTYSTPQLMLANTLPKYNGNLQAGNLWVSGPSATGSSGTNYVAAFTQGGTSDIMTIYPQPKGFGTSIGVYYANLQLSPGPATFYNDINTNKNISATGNITAYGISSGGGNISLSSFYPAAFFAGNLSGNVSGNKVVTGSIYTNNYLYANGVSILSGISGSYGNTQVAAYLPTYTGNLSPGNILTNSYLFANGVSIFTGISGTYSNTQVAAYLTTATINTTGNLQASNMLSNNYLYANGVSILSGISGSYGNTQVAAYIPTDPTITGIQANLGAFETYANVTFSTVANAATQQTQINTNTTGLATLNANVGAFETYANATFISSSSSYGNSNVAAYLASNTDATISNLNANAAVQATSINTINANVGTLYLGNISTQANLGTLYLGNISTQANLGTLYLGNISTQANLGTATTNITTLFANAATQQTQITSLATDANANTAAYLTTSTGNIAAGNIAVTTKTQTGTIYTTNGVFWTGNGAAYSPVSDYGNTQVAAYLAVTPPIAIGTQATGVNAAEVQIGLNAGKLDGYATVAIGRSAGNTSMGRYAIAIGDNATSAGQGTVSVGYLTGQYGTKDYATQVGYNATAIGYSSLGLGSLARASADNSIVLTASNTAVTSTNSGFFVNPIRQDSGNVAQSVYYNTTTKEVTYYTAAGSTYGNTQVAAYLTQPGPIGNTTPGTGNFTTLNAASGITASTVQAGTIGNAGATLTGTLSTAAQTNITSVGTLTSLGVGAVTSSGTIIASTVQAGTIGNAGATLTGTLSTAAQTNITSVGTLTSLNVTNATTVGNLITTNGVFWSNGVSYSSGGTYGNTQVAAYLPTDPTITGIQANLGAFETYANVTFSTVANAATQQTQINTNTTGIATLNANLGAYQTYANTSINTINANLGAYQTYANTSINTINANLGAFETYANTTFLTAASTYGNTQVQQFLTTGPTIGNASSGNIQFHTTTLGPSYGGQTAATVIQSGNIQLSTTANAAVIQLQAIGNNSRAFILGTTVKLQTGGMYDTDLSGAEVTLNPGPYTTYGKPGNVTLAGTHLIANYGNITTVVGVDGGALSSGGWVSGNVANISGNVIANRVISTTGYFWPNGISYGSTLVAGVSQIVAGTGVTISPAGGTGVVTINSTGGYGNANVATYLSTGISSNIVVNGGSYFVGDGSKLTGITTTYGNTQVAAYLPTDTTIINLTANAAVQATSINTINANIGAYHIYANTAIDSINANLGSYQTYANANAATQATAISGITGGTTTLANVISTNGYFWANGTAYSTGGGGGTYGNTQVQEFLTTGPTIGNASSGNIQFHTTTLGTSYGGQLAATVIQSGNIQLYANANASVVQLQATGSGSQAAILGAQVRLTALDNFNSGGNAGLLTLYQSQDPAVLANLTLLSTHLYGTSANITIRQVGTDGGWVSGNVANFSGNVTGSYFVGNGAALTGIFAGNLLGSTLSDSTNLRVFVNATGTSAPTVTNYAYTKNITAPNYIGGVLNLKTQATGQITNVTVVSSQLSANIPLQSHYSTTQLTTAYGAMSYVQTYPVTANSMSNNDRVRALGGVTDVIMAGQTWGANAVAGGPIGGMLAVTNAIGYGTINQTIGQSSLMSIVPTDLANNMNVTYVTGYQSICSLFPTFSTSAKANVAYSRGIAPLTTGMSANLVIQNAVGIHTHNGWAGSGATSTSTAQNRFILLNEDPYTHIQTAGNIICTTTSGTLGTVQVAAYDVTTANSLSGKVGMTIAITNGTAKNIGQLAYWDGTNARWSWVDTNLAVS